MTRATVMTALGLALLGACGGPGGGGAPGTPDGGGGWVPPPVTDWFKLPPIDWSAIDLPKATSGNYVAIEIANAAIEINPFLKDPLTGLGACTDLLTYCYQPGTQSLDSCVAEVKRCATPEPWNEAECCPSTCVAEYEKARKMATPEAAFEQTFFTGGTPCYPGVKTALGVP